MEDFKKDFVPYDRALIMENLGFNEVFKLFDRGVYYRNGRICEANEGALKYFEDCGDEVIIVPTFWQCFRWFREEYNLNPSIMYNGIGQWDYDLKGDWSGRVWDSYEEAELACLDKLIEIVESKSE